MSAPFQDQMEQLLADFAQQQSQLLNLRKELERVSVAVTSKNRLVTVTVGIGGEVRSIKFHRGDYASMAPAELGALLVGVLNDARTKAAAQAQEAFRPFTGFGVEMRDALAGSAELDQLFEPLKDTLGMRPPPSRTPEENDG